MRGFAFFPSGSRTRRGDKVPSLVDLCVQTAIDNLNYMADVGQIDLDLLAKILPHCNAEQLHRIETSTKGMDLSSITNELWHKLYSRKFGADNMNLVEKRMKKKKVSFRWHLLYQAKLKEQEEVQQKCVDRLKQLYQKADIEKQSRQIQLCSKVPPSKKRKSLHSGGGPSNQFNHCRGRLMKKSRIEFTASELKIRKSNVQELPTKVSSQRPGLHSLAAQKSSSKPVNAIISNPSSVKMANPRN